MPQVLDLSTTFIHLGAGGSAEPVKVARSFWSRSAAGKLPGRLVGAFEFSSSGDLHASVQEMHPQADEVLFLVAGAIDVVLDQAEGERTIALEAGQAVIVPRGVWHRLVMRRPGRLLFINSRTAMQSRRHRGAKGRRSRCSPI